MDCRRCEVISMFVEGRINGEVKLCLFWCRRDGESLDCTVLKMLINEAASSAGCVGINFDV